MGEFANSYVLSRMKIKTKGRWLWSRTIGSTIIGEGLDTVIFITLAFTGTGATIGTMIWHHWLFKTGIEVIATPATYAIVNWLKRSEGVDTHDNETKYNPFVLSS